MVETHKHCIGGCREERRELYYLFEVFFSGKKGVQDSKPRNIKGIYLILYIIYIITNFQFAKLIKISSSKLKKIWIFSRLYIEKFGRNNYQKVLGFPYSNL